MRAISIQQPFAQLIVCGLKRLETRPWFTDYRGTLLIHATGNTTVPSSMIQHGQRLLKGIGYDAERLPKRAIIGCVQLFECYSPRERCMNEAIGKLINGDEEQLGFWGLSYWTWELTSPVEFTHPISCAGALQLWTPSPQIIRRCEKIITDAA